MEEDNGQPYLKVSNLSDGQERLLGFLQILSSILSILGSTMIVFLVLKNKRRTPYKRIMLGLSISDILASVTWLLSPFLLSSESQRVWAVGTKNTCTFLGFLSQVTFMAVWYNGMLSFYYLLTIRFGVKSAEFQRWVEPWVHVLSIGYNLGAGIFGYSKEIYSEMELGLGCFISEYPDGCKEDNNCRGTRIGWISAGMPTLFFFVSILVNNFVLYSFVRRTIIPTTNKAIRGHAGQTRRVKEVATQASLYVCTFLMAYTWAFTIRVLESTGKYVESSVFGLLILQSIFLPMQGLFNLFVYSRPNYIRIRRDYPNESRLFALKRAWFGADFRGISVVMTSQRAEKSLGIDETGVLVPGLAEVRQRASQLFTATFSGKGPLVPEVGQHATLAASALQEAQEGDRRRESHWSEQMVEQSHTQGAKGIQAQHMLHMAPTRLIMADEGTEEELRDGANDFEKRPPFSERMHYPGSLTSPANSVPEEVEVLDDDPDEPTIDDFLDGSRKGDNSVSSRTADEEQIVAI